MNKEGKSDIFELNGLINRGYTSVIANAGKVIAVITLLVAALVTFADMAFQGFGSESFTSTLAVMLTASYLMYFSLEDSGEKEGEASEEFCKASDNFLKFRSKVTPDLIDSLREFCLDYSRRELEYRRLSYLGENGLSRRDFEEYKSGKKFPLRSMRAFHRAEKMKAVKLSPALLMSRSHLGGQGEIVDPTKRKIIGAIKSLLPATVCMVFTVSVILTVKENMSISAVIDGIVKLCALPVVGLRGMLDGFRFAKEDKSAWLETKARLLEAFLSDIQADAPSSAALGDGL